jgi:hypothetical protein
MSHKNSTYKPLLAYMCYEYLLSVKQTAYGLVR